MCEIPICFWCLHGEHSHRLGSCDELNDVGARCDCPEYECDLDARTEHTTAALVAPRTALGDAAQHSAHERAAEPLRSLRDALGAIFASMRDRLSIGSLRDRAGGYPARSPEQRALEADVRKLESEHSDQSNWPELLYPIEPDEREPGENT